MEEGLAHQMTFGGGSSQNTKHYYAGVSKALKKCNKCKKCKKKRKK